MSLSQRAPSARVQRLASALAAQPIFWLAFILAMFTWPILRSIRAQRELPHARPVVGVVRDFTVHDQNGDALGTTDLSGRIWVASFTDVDCEPACVQSRRLLQALDELRRRTRNLGDAMRLVTFSADPDRTTDAQLLELAATYRARRGPWRFASGVPERVREILADFGVAEGESSTRVALVDENSMIRGYYDLSDGDALSLLLRDVSLLVARGD